MFSIAEHISRVGGVLSILCDNGGVLHEVLGDDAVEDQQDAERDNEEDGDGEDEEESGPEGVGLSEAHGNHGAVIVFLVGELRHAEDWAAEDKIYLNFQQY